MTTAMKRTMPLFTVAAAWAGLLLLSGQTGGTCTPIPVDPECVADADCTEGQRCQAGVCVCRRDCTMLCPWGYEVDEAGCDVCSCVDPAYDACHGDDDCACGVDRQTGACAFGNALYIDPSRQCPDFCTGIAGHLEIACVNDRCIQRRRSAAK